MNKLIFMLGSFFELLKSIFKKPSPPSPPPPEPFIAVSKGKYVRLENDGRYQIYSAFSKKVVERLEAKEAQIETPISREA